MKVLLTGAGGQLGRALQHLRPVGIDLVAMDLPELDLTQPASVQAAVQREHPDWIINAAAYTRVDQAEREVITAFAINGDGPRLLAEEAGRSGARMLQVSTDYVFPGYQGMPYESIDIAGPLNVYGASKLAGEQSVRELLGDRATVIRTAWLYDHEGPNFVLTMLRLLGERDALSVVDDQVGTPTHADGLARAIWRTIEREISGILHWTDAGIASWYDFAQAIRELALQQGLLSEAAFVHPVPTSAFPRPARRPAYSVMDKHISWGLLDLHPPHWRVALADCLRRIPHPALERSV